MPASRSTMIDVVVLFFLLGVFARLVKSDLRLPEALYETLSIYLLLAIGLKGGIELSKQPLAALAPQVAACMALGFAIPFLLFPVGRALRLGGTLQIDSLAGKGTEVRVILPASAEGDPGGGRCGRTRAGNVRRGRRRGGRRRG